MSWICPNCERELPWEGYRHYCARVNLDSLFKGRSPELVLAFDKILAELAANKLLRVRHAELLLLRNRNSSAE